MRFRITWARSSERIWRGSDGVGLSDAVGGLSDEVGLSDAVGGWALPDKAVPAESIGIIVIPTLQKGHDTQNTDENQ